jgi:hypothetical protein
MLCCCSLQPPAPQNRNAGYLAEVARSSVLCEERKLKWIRLNCPRFPKIASIEEMV